MTVFARTIGVFSIVSLAVSCGTQDFSEGQKKPSTEMKGEGNGAAKTGSEDVVSFGKSENPAPHGPQDAMPEDEHSASVPAVETPVTPVAQTPTGVLKGAGFEFVASANSVQIAQGDSARVELTLTKTAAQPLTVSLAPGANFPAKLKVELLDAQGAVVPSVTLNDSSPVKVMARLSSPPETNTPELIKAPGPLAPTPVSLELSAGAGQAPALLSLNVEVAKVFIVRLKNVTGNALIAARRIEYPAGTVLLLANPPEASVVQQWHLNGQGFTHERGQALMANQAYCPQAANGNTRVALTGALNTTGCNPGVAGQQGTAYDHGGGSGSRGGNIALVVTP